MGPKKARPQAQRTKILRKPYPHKIFRCPHDGCTYRGRLYDLKAKHFPRKHVGVRFDEDADFMLTPGLASLSQGTARSEIIPRNLFTESFSVDIAQTEFNTTYELMT